MYMTTLQHSRPETGNRKPGTRKKKPSGLFKVPLVGGYLGKLDTLAKGRKKIQTTELPAFKGLSGFASSAKKLMESGGRYGMLPEVLLRSRLAAYYAKRLAERCIDLEIKGADQSLVKLTERVSGFTKIGLYLVPQEMTRYEDINGEQLPEKIRTGIRAYPELSRDFLMRFDDESPEFGRAEAMLRCQQVAFDGKGSKSSPSYPKFQRGSDFPLEVQLTKLIEAFCAVLHKSMKAMPEIDVENQIHTELAAATMITVAGKDVSPTLTAALLSTIYPYLRLVYTKAVVSNLRHQNPRDLERKEKEDLRYALEVVLKSNDFQNMKIENKRLEREEKRREERRRQKEFRKLPFEDTFVCTAGKVAKRPVETDSWDQDNDSWDDETVPGCEFPVSGSRSQKARN